MKKKLAIIGVILVIVAMSVLWGLPAFAQTHLATLIPGQPLSAIAAEQIITHSGLPQEVLPGGKTNSLTRGRDAVNAYRYAHEQLSSNGWYRGIGEDHTPLLAALVNELGKQGFKSDKPILQEKSAEVLEKFWHDSNTQNAKELGYDDLEELNIAVADMDKAGKGKEAKDLKDSLDDKWK